MGHFFWIEKESELGLQSLARVSPRAEIAAEFLSTHFQEIILKIRVYLIKFEVHLLIYYFNSYVLHESKLHKNTIII
jgi:hypothetical protein